MISFLSKDVLRCAPLGGNVINGLLDKSRTAVVPVPELLQRDTKHIRHANVASFARIHSDTGHDSKWVLTDT